MKHKDIDERMKAKELMRMKRKDLGVINRILEKERIISLETLAEKATKILFKYKRLTYDEDQILRHDIFNQKNILKKEYGIKSLLGLEEAIKIVYPEEKFELFVNPNFPRYGSSFHSFVWTENIFFYKKEEDLKEYIKSHTKPEKINTIRWVH